MQTKRPVFLQLWRIRLPASGYVSILHRISGVLMVLAIPGGAWLLHRALSGPAGFDAAASILGSWPARLLLLILTWALLHHLFAGIRFLLLDFGFGVDRTPARQSAIAAIAAGLIATLLVVALGGSVAR